MGMTAAKRDELRRLLGQDQADQVIAAAERLSVAAEQTGTKYKELTDNIKVKVNVLPPAEPQLPESPVRRYIEQLRRLP